MSKRRRVLFVCHGHPSVRPGGAEAYALELHEAIRDLSSRFKPFLMAYRAAEAADGGQPRLATIGGADPSQFFLVSAAAGFNPFTGRHGDRRVLELFCELLEDLRPDIVHFQHTLFLGYDLIGVVRQILPHAAIVYTLHEFLPICHHDGQMLRTYDGSPCRKASSHACHQCFPAISVDQFFFRRLFVQSQFARVDHFIAPSRFLRDRYIDWGIPAERICFEEYGRRVVRRIADPEFSRPRHTLGFFGQLTPFKGADVLLEAMRLLARRGSPARLRVHGANLDRQRPVFQQKLRKLLEDSRHNVTLLGSYQHADLPRLMADVDWVVVPSIWWENSPLVIQEAFQHSRPVICSDIGGMAEKVTHDVDGLHFRAADTNSLADVIDRAIHTPDLWERLRGGIASVHPMEQHLNWVEALYLRLIESHTPELVEGSAR